MTRGEKRALTLWIMVHNGTNMAKAAKQMGIPFSAAQRIMERYKNREYTFQKERPWLGWAVRVEP